MSLEKSIEQNRKRDERSNGVIGGTDGSYSNQEREWRERAIGGGMLGDQVDHQEPNPPGLSERLSIVQVTSFFMWNAIPKRDPFEKALTFGHEKVKKNTRRF